MITIRACPAIFLIFSVMHGGFFWGCTSEDQVNLPSLTTIPVTEITSNTANSGVIITDNGGGNILSMGIVWGTGIDPTIEANETCFSENLENEEFVCLMSDLEPETEYFVRAFATNSAGTAYGSHFQFQTLKDYSVTDIDGNVYRTVVIGEQEWMAENLKTTTYSNGQPIPRIIDSSTWARTPSGAYTIYDHTTPRAVDIPSEEAMVEAYGLLYNWYAVNSANGLCPAGWRVPTNSDWTQLINFISGGASLGGNQLKSCRQIDSPLEGVCDTDIHPRWDANESHYGTDDFGFSALPAGGREADGSWYWVGRAARFWSATPNTSTTAYRRNMMEDAAEFRLTSINRRFGQSVRCIRVD